MTGTSITQSSTWTRVSWSAAAFAGIIAGALYAAIQMLLMPLAAEGSPWVLPRMIAAIVLGAAVAPPPATFEGGVLLTALVVHFSLSIIYAIVLAAIVSRVRLGTGAVLGTGLAFGLVLYLVNYYGFTVIFPWFAIGRNWVTLLGHLVYGVAAAWVYLTFRHLQARPTPRGAA